MTNDNKIYNGITIYNDYINHIKYDGPTGNFVKNPKPDNVNYCVLHKITTSESSTTFSQGNDGIYVATTCATEKNDDTPYQKNVKAFKKDLEHLINKHSLENGSDTPDYMIAEYLVNCLDNFNKIQNLKQSEQWYAPAGVNRGLISGTLETAKTPEIVTPEKVVYSDPLLQYGSPGSYTTEAITSETPHDITELTITPQPSLAVKWDELGMFNSITLGKSWESEYLCEFKIYNNTIKETTK